MLLEGKDSDPLSKKFYIFPRYHQLDVVQRLIADVRKQGVGSTYLVQHSAGSGKSNSITWTAFQLIEVEDQQGMPLFDSVIVVTDRRVLDRQLRDNIKSFSEVKNIIGAAFSSSDLRLALESGKRIVITTIQKFPHILEDIDDMSDKRFAIIIDEAHSSQGGSAADKMNQVLGKLDTNEEGEVDAQDLILRAMEARKMRQEYAQRFENIGAVDRLLSTKRNSSDRVVAFNDVFQKSIINGTLDDVKNLGYALKKSGDEGLQALRELRGQTIEYLKDRVTQSIDTDMFGNPVVSPAKFKSAVRELDQDGKLDYLFGKKGAQEIRDLMETTIMVNAPLKGAANYSNTASAVIRGLDMINRSPIGKIPVVGSLTKYSFEKAQEKALKQKIKESINYSPSKMAEELKKGK
jgi:hypothetical protein